MGCAGAYSRWENFECVEGREYKGARGEDKEVNINQVQLLLAIFGSGLQFKGMTEDKDLTQTIEKVLDTLSPREAEVINLYFGLYQKKALTLEEIGLRFNLSRERVRQIKEKAIRRLRHASRVDFLKSYLED